MSKKEKKENSKKDKKRKDKKSKKSKKSNKHEGEKKRSDSHKHDRLKREATSNKISEILSIGMVVFPQLQTDLSGILMALDSNKQFQLLDNGDKFNSFLLEVFKQLPLKEQNSVWTKVDRSTNLRKYVIDNLLASSVIQQPNTLTTAETLAMRAANTMQPLLIKFPSLWNDITPLLNNFIAGEAVDVSGIEIKAIKEGLCSFFKSIGAAVDDTEEDNSSLMTFILPPKSSSGQSHKEVKKAIRYFADLFAFTKGMTDDLSIEVDTAVALPADDNTSDSSSSSSSSSSGEEDEDSMR
jgi:hypothetical protein